MMRCSAGRGSRLELHRRRLLDFGAAGAEIEKVLARKAERAGEQGGRHLLDAGVVFLDRAVEEAPAGGDLVLEVGEFVRQLLEVGIGLEIGRGLRKRGEFSSRDAPL